MAKKLKAGDSFIFHKCKVNKFECEQDDFTIGKIYELYVGEEGLEFRDDTGEGRCFEIRIMEEGMKVTKIIF